MFFFIRKSLSSFCSLWYRFQFSALLQIKNPLTIRYSLKMSKSRNQQQRRHYQMYPSRQIERLLAWLLISHPKFSMATKLPRLSLLSTQHQAGHRPALTILVIPLTNVRAKISSVNWNLKMKREAFFITKLWEKMELLVQLNNNFYPCTLSI